MISFPLFFSIFVTLVDFLLGMLVLANGPRNRINKVFSSITFVGGALWLTPVFISDIYKDPNIVLFWTQMAIIGPSFVAPLFLYFSKIFPFKREKIITHVSILSFLPAFLFLFLIKSNLNVESVEIRDWGAEFTPGPLYNALLVYFVTCFAIGIKNLLISYKKSTKIQKDQIIYVFLGVFFAILIGGITNLVLPIVGYSRLATLGSSLAVLSFVVFSTYAIMKHYLMNIKIIAIEVFLFSMIGILVFQTTLANSFFELMISILVTVVFTFTSYLLIRKSLNEIKYRERLKSINKELGKLSQSKSEFFSIASHQLRAPLTIVKGYISMVLEGDYGKIPEEAKEPLNNVFQSNERLISLVNEFLNLSRLESGKIEVRFESVALDDLIKDVVKEMKVSVDAKGLSLSIDVPSPLPEIIADKQKIRQVILNIIDNAIKYTDKGWIKIRVEKDGLKERVSISDSGMGMTEKDIDSVFEIFTRARAAQSHKEGSGVGLYVAKKFIEMHNGDIKIESQGEGKGTTFIVELPILNKHEKDTKQGDN